MAVQNEFIPTLYE
jgi:hypothetical protein